MGVSSEAFSGYKHMCRNITVTERAMVEVQFQFESLDDPYSRYFTYSIDCPEIRDKRKYLEIPFDLEDDLCKGFYQNLGVGELEFEETRDVPMEAGEHVVCAWPSSIENLSWGVDIHFGDHSPMGDLPPETSDLEKVYLTGVRNRYGFLELGFQNGWSSLVRVTSVGVSVPGEGVKECLMNMSWGDPFRVYPETITRLLCKNVAYESGQSLEISLSTETETKSYALTTPGEPVESYEDETSSGDGVFPACTELNLSECTDVVSCRITDCGCLREDVDCDPPEEQGPVKCRGGCVMNAGCLQTGTLMALEEGMEYCSVDGEWVPQKAGGSPCSEGYECQSHECFSGRCSGFREIRLREIFQKFLDFFDRLFGGKLRFKIR